LLIGYLAFNQVIVPAAAEMREKKRALAAARAQNETARKIEATFPAFIGEFKQAWSDYQSASQLLPEEVEVSGVLGAVQKIAAREGVKVTRFDAVKEGGKSRVADKLQERAVSAQIVGTHGAVTRFLAQVASYPRIIHVREFSITSLKDGESVDLVIAAYYAPPPDDLPPLPKQVTE
jgi:Tfp pilus assembly protein PilO